MSYLNTTRSSGEKFYKFVSEINKISRIMKTLTEMQILPVDIFNTSF